MSNEHEPRANDHGHSRSPRPSPHGRDHPDDRERGRHERHDRRDSHHDREGRHPREDKPRGWRGHPRLVGIGVIVLIALVVVVVLWTLHSRGYEKTDDAYIDAMSERVSPRVTGRVTKVLVNDNQDVTAGQTLLELDSADFRTHVAQAQAARAQAQAQLAQARAQVTAQNAHLAQSQASQVAADSARENANSEFERFRKLRDLRAGAVSQEQFDRAETAARNARAQADAAARAVAAAEAQVDLARSAIEAAQAGIAAADAQLQQTELTLSYTTLKAQTSGRIAGLNVAIGNNVQPGTELMAIVPREVYVTANFKETQLDQLRHGQAVEVKVDSYPDFKLNARVDSVQPAAGQAFSLLPAQNAVGNWVKVVQRVPVKIVFDRMPDDPDRRLAPGMSVAVKVSIR